MTKFPIEMMIAILCGIIATIGGAILGIWIHGGLAGAVLAPIFGCFGYLFGLFGGSIIGILRLMYLDCRDRDFWPLVTGLLASAYFVSTVIHVKEDRYALMILAILVGFPFGYGITVLVRAAYRMFMRYR